MELEHQTETADTSSRCDFKKYAFKARMQWEDLNWERTSYSAFGAYQQSKLANLLFSAELANKLEGSGVR